ncbi:MAG: hypothetical protein EPN75_04040 [Beijerinckiaceae bacterium]|nr:MAG: hypothetical protein EPN75_04040 [Beijerinckiaceae bacterium]
MPFRASTRPLSFGVAGAFAIVTLAGSVFPAVAHTIVGNRVFPATLTIDDPGVNDELALPAFAYMPGGLNPDGTRESDAYNLGWEYAKTITPTLGISVGSDGYSWQRNPRAEGWANIETELKYVFYENPEHEFIISGATDVEWGNTGSSSAASLPSDPFTTVTPKIFIGKGFGDLHSDWLRPIAITGEMDYSIPTRSFNALDGSLNPTVLTYGASLQYSLLYANSNVHQMPEVFSKLVPAFEGIFSSPISNTGPSMPGQWVHETTGVVGPSIYYIGQYFEVGVMAQIPVNAASGRHVGAMAVIDFFLDDIAPDTLGKPLFGAPPSRAANF